jgi:hypothetical protein
VVLGTDVRQLALLPVTIDVLDRIQLRRIGGQILLVNPALERKRVF